MEALAVLSCSIRSIFTACDCFWLFIFSIISFVLSLQMFILDHGWRCIPVSVKPDLEELVYFDTTEV